MDVSIIILNWNGLNLLKTCIPSVREALGAYANKGEIILLDNGSSDASPDYVKSFFPEIRVVSLGDNLAFTKAINIGLRCARYPIVICLNNDTIVDKDFIAPLTAHFLKDKDIFAAGARMLLWDRKMLNFGKVTAGFRYGFFTRRISDSDSAAYTLYASAGGFAVDKDKFLALGGFDEDITIYWEDLDLCYRAWKRGWKVIYEPKSLIYHKLHGTNLDKYKKSGIDLLSGQNYSLFIMKNIHDKSLFYRHLFFSPLLVLGACLSGRPYFAKGIIKSLGQYHIFLRKRKEEKNKAVISDRKVFEFLCR